MLISNRSFLHVEEYVKKLAQKMLVMQYLQRDQVKREIEDIKGGVARANVKFTVSVNFFYVTVY